MKTMEDASARRANLKEKAKEEFRAYWIITLYLAIFLGALTVYRRLILAEFGVLYLHYGVAVVEALIIAKVILIGKAFGFTRWLEDRALIYPVLFKSLLFGALVFLFGLVEHLVDGWIHKENFAAIVDKIASIGIYELGSRALLLIIAFVPFFAFWELGRVIGMRRLGAMFFSKPEAPGEAEGPAK